MIVAKKQFLQPIYYIFQENSHYGKLKNSWFVPKASFFDEKQNYQFFRERWSSGTYFLSIGNSYIARASKSGGIGSSYSIKYRYDFFELKPGDTFYQKSLLDFKLSQNDSVLGNISQNSSSFQFAIDIGGEIPTLVKVFIFWLSILAWKAETGWDLAGLLDAAIGE